MMESPTSQQYQRLKHSWLTFGRLLLTVTVLALITLVLYYLANGGSGVDHTSDDNQSVLREKRWIAAAAAAEIGVAAGDKISMPIESNKSSWKKHHRSQHQRDDDSKLTATTTTTTAFNNEMSVANATAGKVVVKGDTNPKTINKSDKNKKKSKRKKSHRNVTKNNSDSSSVVMPKIKLENFTSNIDEAKVALNSGGDSVLFNERSDDVFDELSPLMVADSFNVAAAGESPQHKVRHKKDRLIIREESVGEVVVRRQCIPCRIVPGQVIPRRNKPSSSRSKFSRLCFIF